MRIGLLSLVLIFGLGAAVLLPARAQQTPPVTLQGELHAKLEAEINRVADRLNGVLGYAIKDLSTGESFYRNAHAHVDTDRKSAQQAMIEVVRLAQSSAGW